MKLTCPSPKGNPRTTSLQVVAKANNLELELVEADAANPSIEHKKANPLGKIPAFVGEDGYTLSEVIAIAIYRTYPLVESPPHAFPGFGRLDKQIVILFTAALAVK